jgi:hypothetical protein
VARGRDEHQPARQLSRPGRRQARPSTRPRRRLLLAVSCPTLVP